MNKTEQAEQLRLAAEIIETGHPFEFHDGEEWIVAWNIPPLEAVSKGYLIRLTLATPPDGRPLHNPDNLTAEQVGVGYRLLTQDEFQKDMHLEHQEWWGVYHKPRTWVKEEAKRSRCPSGNYGTTYRLPLFVPWPTFSIATLAQDQVDLTAEQHAAVEACLQDKAPPFQLPPPPPDMKWHREDGWKEGDLPQGYRPLVLEEHSTNATQQRYTGGWMRVSDSVIADPLEEPMRTSRPLTFTHLGETWTWHKPGDPMPCNSEAQIYILCVDAVKRPCSVTAINARWDKKNSADIIGWRYAEPETKTVSLGPDDVPPCSVVSGVESRWLSITCCHKDGVYVQNSEDNLNLLTWSELLRDGVKINRSIPLTGKWDANAWEPCSKEVQA